MNHRPTSRFIPATLACLAVTVALGGCAPAGQDAAPPASPAAGSTQPAPPASPAPATPAPATTAPASPAASPVAPASTPAPAATPAPVSETPAEEVPNDPFTTGPEEESPAATAPASPAATVSDVVQAATLNKWVDSPKSAPKKYVFLTFDDGPNSVRTPEVLDVLEDKGVKATFFILGSQVSEAPEVLQRTHDSGHGICMHSQTHKYEKLYPGRKANAERVGWEFDESLKSTQGALGADFTTTCWRYPGGHMSWKNMGPADAALLKRGVTWIDWNAMTGDAEPKSRRPSSADGMVRMATAPIRNSEKVVVVLAHDTPDKKLTVKSLPAIIDAYKKAGYTFGVIS